MRSILEECGSSATLAGAQRPAPSGRRRDEDRIDRIIIPTEIIFLGYAICIRMPNFETRVNNDDGRKQPDRTLLIVGRYQTGYSMNSNNYYIRAGSPEIDKWLCSEHSTIKSSICIPIFAPKVHINKYPNHLTVSKCSAVSQEGHHRSVAGWMRGTWAAPPRGHEGDLVRGCEPLATRLLTWQKMLPVPSGYGKSLFLMGKSTINGDFQ